MTPSSDGIFSKPSSQTFVTKCVVEFAALESLDLSTYHSLQASGVHGTLGLINLGADIFLCVITAAARVATVRPGENVQKILSVEFCWSSWSPLERRYHGVLMENKTA